jgi:hypothetical protein
MTKDISNPFTFVNDIFEYKKDIIRNSDDPTLAESYYSPYLTNKALSFHADSIFYANEMNECHQLDKQLQYDFLLNSIRAYKRKHAWIKSENNEDLQLLCEYFKINMNRAEEYLKILTTEQVDEIKKIVSGE